MRLRLSPIRAARFRAEEARQQARRIEETIAAFERMAAELGRQITAEEERTGLRDPDYFAYPTFAKAAIQRRDNLNASAARLKAELARAKLLLAAAEKEVERLEKHHNAAPAASNRGSGKERARKTAGKS